MTKFLRCARRVSNYGCRGASAGRTRSRTRRGNMPRGGSKPGERRGDRKKGSLSEATIERALKAERELVNANETGKRAFERCCPVMHAGTLKRVEAINSGPPITCAAGNDDRSRADPLTVGQLQAHQRHSSPHGRTSPKLGLQFIGSRVEDFQRELFVVHCTGYREGADKCGQRCYCPFSLGSWSDTRDQLRE
jgi:hypothetical protein